MSHPVHTARPALALVVVALAACSTDRATAPAAEDVARPAYALVNETGAAMICNSSAPITVAVTTIDRRGRTVPLSGQVLSFRAMNTATELFVGVGITNTSGQVVDQVTAGATPGRPVQVEVRSIDQITGLPVTHLSLTRPVVMPTSATLTGSYSDGVGIAFSIPPEVRVKVTPGCAPSGGLEPLLPAGTPVEFVLATGVKQTLEMNGLSNEIALRVPFQPVGGVITAKIGSASTGLLSVNIPVN